MSDLTDREPILPLRVNERFGLYTRQNSDLFIDDLTPNDLRMIAEHLEWKETKTNKYE